MFGLINMVGALLSATRRSAVCVLVALSMCVNVAAGSFTGIVHAHEHEHSHSHAHDDGGGHVHHGEPAFDDQLAPMLPADSGNGHHDHHDLMHEHGGIILALTDASGLPMVVKISALGSISSHLSLADRKHDLERPPRRA